MLPDDQNEGPPTTAGALLWRNNFGLNSIYVMADPNFSMVPGTSVGTPQGTVVNPRTMQVVLVEEAWVPSDRIVMEAATSAAVPNPSIANARRMETSLEFYS